MIQVFLLLVHFFFLMSWQISEGSLFPKYLFHHTTWSFNRNFHHCSHFSKADRKTALSNKASTWKQSSNWKSETKFVFFFLLASSPPLAFSKVKRVRGSCCGCSVAKSCQTLCDPEDFTKPGSPVPHYLSEFAQIHVH